MNEFYFDTQIKFLEETYGPKAFNDYRKKMIWESVKDLDDTWISTQVRRFVSTSKFAPMPADFAEAAAIQRRTNKVYEDEKPFNSVLTKEESAEFHQILRDVGRGKYNRKQVKELCQYVEKVLQSKGVRVENWREHLN